MIEINDVGFSQGPGGYRHPEAPYAEHIGEELLSEIELVVANAVVRHEKLSRASLGQAVQSGASDGLAIRFISDWSYRNTTLRKTGSISIEAANDLTDIA